MCTSVGLSVHSVGLIFLLEGFFSFHAHINVVVVVRRGEAQWRRVRMSVRVVAGAVVIGIVAVDVVVRRVATRAQNFEGFTHGMRGG